VPVMTQVPPACATMDAEAFHPPIGSIIETTEPLGAIDSAADFIRVTDEQ